MINLFGAVACEYSTRLRASRLSDRQYFLLLCFVIRVQGILEGLGRGQTLDKKMWLWSSISKADHSGVDDAAVPVYVLVTLGVSYLCSPVLGSVLCYVSLTG